jgi:hypothetical protein
MVTQCDDRALHALDTGNTDFVGNVFVFACGHFHETAYLENSLFRILSVLDATWK